jgi:predicted permease
VRYALRQFWHSKVFTITAIATLAIGIGGTTAIFTLIHEVMLRSLPVADPASLYRIGSGDDCCVMGGPQDQWGMFSWPLYERLVANTPEFEQTTAFQAGRGRISVRRQGVDVSARPLRSEYVSGTYFSTFGVGAFGGRVLSPDDDKASAAPVVVLSHYVFENTYGGDSSVVGSTFVIENHPFTVIGVAPPGFFGDTLQGDPPDVWIPLQQEPLVAGAADGNGSLLRQPVSAWLRTVGRLHPGATVDAMGPRLTTLLRDWMQHDSGYPSNWMPEVQRVLPKQTITIVPAGAGIAVMKEQYGESLQLLLAVCGLVLLIACANVANLLLARAAARRGQTAVRLAVGASRRQIVTQALVESVLLAVAGGATGLLVANGAARLLLSLAFTNTRFLPISTTPSLVVLGFAFALALVTGVIFGAAPAWFATRTDPIDALRGAGRTTGDHSSLTRQALLIAQATLSVVLVAGATMLGRSLNNLQHQNFGFQIPGRVIVSLNNPTSGSTPAQLTEMYRNLESRLRALPGVQSAALAMYNPLTDNWGEGILVAGHPAPKPGEPTGSSWDRVSATYLQDIGVTLVRGRFFTEADNETTAPVAVVNEAFVKRFFKSDEEPLGEHFGLDMPENVGSFRIVGIVRDAKFAGFQLSRPARPMFYAALAQQVEYKDVMMRRLERSSHVMRGALLVTQQSPGALEPQITRVLSQIDPNMTLNSVRTLEHQVSLTFNQERAVASLAGLFGVVALLLAAVGLYGVTAYSVAQRTNEIGIRMALGAARGNVIDLVLRTAFRRVAIGLVLGLPLAVGAGRLLATQLYGVNFWDPIALAIATAALGGCALVAALIPAGRAASISPIRALRTE